ncbi:MAG: hypothetical protein ABW023_15355 [Sphingomonas sp.]
MSIYRRDEILPEWEPVPWPRGGKAADRQEQGFHERAQLPIHWQPIPWKAFPSDGVFGLRKEPLMSLDAAYFASLGAEDLLLIDNTWFDWPDPPRWGLVSRLQGRSDLPWDHWGHFPDLPSAWIVPVESGGATAVAPDGN